MPPAPVVSKPEMPEPGGFVTDASGVERYDGANDLLAEHQAAAAEREMKRAEVEPPMRPGELDAALSAHRKTGAPDLPLAYGRIVQITFAFDPDKVFDTLNDRLKFKKPIHQMGFVDLAQELDDAAGLHRDASRLLAHSKVTLAEFEADVEAIRGDMRAQAVAQLKAEKEAKGGKQITDGDVTARMANLFPDEYRRQERLAAQAKATIAHLETMVKVWELRRREINTMLSECRNRS